MTTATQPHRYVPLDVDQGLWEHFYTVAPLVLVGTIEQDGSPDVAPKHQASPIGHGSLFGFVCSAHHATYRNAVATGAFTIGFPSPDMVLLTSLAAAPRDAAGNKPTLELVSLSPATMVAGVLVDGCRAHLECRMHRVVDDLDGSSLVIGRVVAAYASQRALRESGSGGLPEQSALLAYLHPGRVTSIHQSKEFPYHRGYHE